MNRTPTPSPRQCRDSDDCTSNLLCAKAGHCFGSTRPANEAEALRLTALLVKMRDRCAEMAEGYIYGSAAGRAIRTIELDVAVREYLAEGSHRA